ncbi:DGQHR domain-containing protein [Pedobacter sp. Leaf170]|uniref:DGQHR domain-containing protein n=1 Tax=Pedobacter sp. Leaf170 TaxID=2876558 RepID=UPI001E37CA98|nr:DGQHR domain-containing protein [Pedobacter sp. Leaf170]
MRIEIINGEKFGFVVGSLVSQPIGDFFVCSMGWSVLQEIAISNPRMLIAKDENGVEEYRGIQRQVTDQRKKDIMDYIKSPYATFPSSIIINFPSEFLDLIPLSIDVMGLTKLENYHNEPLAQLVQPINVEAYILSFPIRNGIAQIIDGQHRLAAFENFGSVMVFDLPVTIFMNQTLERQAEVFAVINGKQTRVSPSLVYDLFGITEKPTPYKVANDLVKMLNESVVSPLKENIKILGKANDFYKGVITQSTVAQNIIALICGAINQAEKDKQDVLKEQKLDSIPTLTKKKAPLRIFFLNKEYELLFKIIVSFFTAVAKTFPEEWNDENSVLKKTVGMNALFKYLAYLSQIGIEQGDLTQSFFEDQISVKSHINLKDIQLSSKGINQIYNQLVAE